MKLSPFTRRLLAVALLVFAVALPYWLGVRPLLDRFAENRAEIEQQRDLLSRYRAVAMSVEGLRETLDQLKASEAGADFYLTGDSEALVAAQLQNRLKTIIGNSGGRLTSTQVMQPGEEAGFRQVTIRVRMNCGIEGLRQIMYALETELPFLFVDNVDVSSRQERSRQTNTEAEPELTVSFDVFGYLRPNG